MTDDDSCQAVEISGQVVRVRGASGELTDLDKQRLEEVLAAARRRFEHEDALQRLTDAGVIGRRDCKVRRQD